MTHKYSLLSISGTSTGSKKMVLIIKCFTYPNGSIKELEWNRKKSLTYRTSFIKLFERTPLICMNIAQGTEN